MAMNNSAVKLHIYDVSRGLARQMSHILLGKQIDGIWHTGVVIYGKEFFFGSGGIQYCPPCGTIMGDPDEVKDLGITEIPEDVFNQYLLGLNQENFRPEKYNLFEHNCNTFSNEAAQFLTGRTIPKHIQDLPKDILNTPFGAMIKPIFDSMSAQPYSTNATSVTTANPEINPDPNLLLEPRPANPRCKTNNSDTFISEGPKIKLMQSKDVPVICDNYKISSLISSLKQTAEENELTEHEIEEVNKIEEMLQSEDEDKVEKDHFQLLEKLLEKYEHSGHEEILTNIIRTLGLLILKDGVILLVCQDSVSKPVFKLAREFARLKSLDVQCAVVELFTNICSTDAGREIFVAEENLDGENLKLPIKSGGEKSSPDASPIPDQNVGADGNELSFKRSAQDSEQSTNGRKGTVAHHQTSTVDHRDVVQVTVKGLLSDDKKLCEKAAALVYNISMAKVSEESALECASAILECLKRNDDEIDTVYHCLFALKNFMKISPEVVNLASLIGIELPKFVKLSKKIEYICNEVEQYLIV